MIQRQTQDPAYWREEYEIDDSDHEFLYELLAEADEPQRLESLAIALIQRRQELEESRIRKELTRGLLYDPKEAYKVGDRVVFPHFNFRLAEVVDMRAGDNPEYGPFDVITVRFENASEKRMFAANLAAPHALNRESDEVIFDAQDLLTPPEILAQVKDALLPRLEAHLREHPDIFVSAGALWLTTDQMVEVNLGHLNIAEAAIDVNAAPMSTDALLETVELDLDIPESVRIFSLETALYQDERFAQVGEQGKMLWFLRRMMPPEAVETPPILQYEPVEYDRAALSVELLQAEWELNDEWTEGGLAEEAPPAMNSAVVHLIYPHLVSGTLPLPPNLRAFFPKGDGFATAVTFIDGRWGNRFPGWVVHEGRYVAGLREWYKQHKLAVGVRISVERGEAPGEVVVDFKPHRPRREWVRTAYVTEGRLTFEMLRYQFSFVFDDHLVLQVADDEAMAEYAQMLRDKGVSVEELVRQIAPELIKLSPQGVVHVKTLYSAINVVRRCPPGPIFATLAQLPGAVDTGSGYWSI
ncbi:MAG: hypothetical protein GXP42_11020 [Chloroflexi bacterium]|nr:hypothetical protein [Chloroflexota bacterium]